MDERDELHQCYPGYLFSVWQDEESEKVSLTPIHTSYLTTSALTAYLHHIHTAYIYLHSCHIYSPVPHALTAFGIKLLITALCGSLSRPQISFCLELPCLALCWESNSSTTFAISCMHHVHESLWRKREMLWALESWRLCKARDSDKISSFEDLESETKSYEVAWLAWELLSFCLCFSSIWVTSMCYYI